MYECTLISIKIAILWGYELSQDWPSSTDRTCCSSISSHYCSLVELISSRFSHLATMQHEKSSVVLLINVMLQLCLWRLQVLRSCENQLQSTKNTQKKCASESGTRLSSLATRFWCAPEDIHLPFWNLLTNVFRVLCVLFFLATVCNFRVIDLDTEHARVSFRRGLVCGWEQPSNRKKSAANVTVCRRREPRLRVNHQYMWQAYVESVLGVLVYIYTVQNSTWNVALGCVTQRES